MLMKWKNLFLHLLYPPRCPACRAAVAQAGQWCPACLAAVWRPRRISRTAAVRSLDSCYCLTDYGGAMRNILHRLKYNGTLSYSTACQYVIAQFPWMDRLSHIDLVVPVPLAPEKERQRGFNQTDLLFRSWAEQHWTWSPVLQRVRMTAAQWQLGRQERKENIKRAFEIKGPHLVQGKHILLVDDIYTTGTTMEACARALKQGGALSVTGLVVASNAV